MGVHLSSLQTILSEFYNELRWYRDKEFQSFIFAVPVIGVGFIESFDSYSILVVLSILSALVIFYLYGNHNRMLEIKKVIVSIQDDLETNHIISNNSAINPKKWPKKKIYQHLGTTFYIGFLIFESLGMWLVKLKIIAF